MFPELVVTLLSDDLGSCTQQLGCLPVYCVCSELAVAALLRVLLPNWFCCANTTLTAADAPFCTVPGCCSTPSGFDYLFLGCMVV
jgi:hypothetical protein